MARYTVKPGDSWAKIAGKVYGDQRMFQEIMKANPNIRVLQPGMKLRLPSKVAKPVVTIDPRSVPTGRETGLAGAPAGQPVSQVAAKATKPVVSEVTGTPSPTIGETAFLRSQTSPVTGTRLPAIGERALLGRSATGPYVGYVPFTASSVERAMQLVPTQAEKWQRAVPRTLPQVEKFAPATSPAAPAAPTPTGRQPYPMFRGGAERAEREFARTTGALAPKAEPPITPHQVDVWAARYTGMAIEEAVKQKRFDLLPYAISDEVANLVAGSRLSVLHGEETVEEWMWDHGYTWDPRQWEEGAWVLDKAAGASAYRDRIDRFGSRRGGGGGGGRGRGGGYSGRSEDYLYQWKIRIT